MHNLHLSTSLYYIDARDTKIFLFFNFFIIFLLFYKRSPDHAGNDRLSYWNQKTHSQTSPDIPDSPWVSHNNPWGKALHFFPSTRNMPAYRWPGTGRIGNNPKQKNPFLSSLSHTLSTSLPSDTASEADFPLPGEVPLQY